MIRILAIAVALGTIGLAAMLHFAKMLGVYP